LDWFLAKYALYPNIVILVGYGTQGGTTFLLPEIIFLPYCVGYINVYWTSIGILPQECSLHDMLRRYSTTTIQFKRSLAEALILNMVMPTLEQMISSQRFNHPRGA
jgi:hypothetical protein